DRVMCTLFFFQAEDGIRDFHVTGVQTCALPIFRSVSSDHAILGKQSSSWWNDQRVRSLIFQGLTLGVLAVVIAFVVDNTVTNLKIGRASCRERGEQWEVAREMTEQADTWPAKRQ